MPLPSLGEIKDRKLVQWGLAYLAGAWLVLQVIAVLGATYDWPTGLLRAVPVVLAVGFLVALVVAWYHGEKGEQKVSGVELSILAVLLGLAGLGVMLVAGPSETNPSAAVSEEAREADRTRLAVLPFESIGADEDHFADGMTVELIEVMSRIPGLRVTGQTSSFAFQDADVPTDSIGRVLDVGYFVEGTVRPLGDSVRVTARLVEAASGATEWSETFEGDLTDAFGVQNDIARAVAVQLRTQFGDEALAVRETADPEAYRLVLRSRHVRAEGGRYFEALRLAEEAIALDSTYASAWHAVCASLYLIGWNELNEDPGADFRASRAACERATTLNPNLAAAHSQLGHYAALDGDLEAAEAYFERALDANPSRAMSRAQLAQLRLAEGDTVRAVREAERAIESEPLHWNPRVWAGHIYARIGNAERAAELFREAGRLGLNDSYTYASYFAVMLAEAGQTDEALAWTRRSLGGDPTRAQRQRVYRQNAAYVFALAGDRAEAERLLGTLNEDEAYWRAAVETALGDHNAAFEALERAGANRPDPRKAAADAEVWSGNTLMAGSYFRPLHGDARWERLMSRVRVAPPQGG